MTQARLLDSLKPALGNLYSDTRGARLGVNYQKVSDDSLVVRARKRYQPSTSQLRKLGFEEFCIVAEQSFPFSAIFVPLILPMLANREVVSIMPPLRLSLTYPVMLREESTTYCMVFGRGVKFYTGFVDGHMVVSGNTGGGLNRQDDSRRFLSYTAAGISIDEAWERHQSYCKSFLPAGLHPAGPSSYEHFVQLSVREDEMFAISATQTHRGLS